jgi:hypothetical protein
MLETSSNPREGNNMSESAQHEAYSRLVRAIFTETLPERRARELAEAQAKADSKN